MQSRDRARSASVVEPDYWWYGAREHLLQAVLAPSVEGATMALDVGSADGASVDWLDRLTHRVALDVDAAALPRGGVCGSALSLPFPDAAFEVVSAFDVIEHFADDGPVLAELARVLIDGGRLLLSVPAYQWAWSDFDVWSGHHRRYTAKRLVAVLEANGFSLRRVTYFFGGVLPLFAAQRLLAKRGSAQAGRLPQTPASVAKLLMTISGLEARLLRRVDLPFGSSIAVAAVRRSPSAVPV